MRDLAKRFKDKQDIKFEAQNNKLVIKKKILTNINIRRDAKKHSGLAMKNPEVQLGKCLILILNASVRCFIFSLKICLERLIITISSENRNYSKKHFFLKFEHFHLE